MQGVRDDIDEVFYVNEMRCWIGEQHDERVRCLLHDSFHTSPVSVPLNLWLCIAKADGNTKLRQTLDRSELDNRRIKVINHPVTYDANVCNCFNYCIELCQYRAFFLE